MKMNRPFAAAGRAEHISELRDEFEQLKGAIYELTEGEAKGQPNSELMARGLQRELERVGAEMTRELDAYAGVGPRTVLAKGESMASAIDGPQYNVGIGQIVRALATGKWDGIQPEVRAMVTTAGPTGPGGSIPGDTAGAIVDLARERSILFNHGAKLMPIETPGAKVARMLTEPAVQWAPESAERLLDIGSFTFDAAELTAYSAFLFAEYSLEAVEDVVNLDQALMDSFSQQLALTFDVAGIAGDGAEMPLGFQYMNTAEDRVLEYKDIGAVTHYTPFVYAAGMVRAAHYVPKSVLLTPGMWTHLNVLENFGHDPLGVPRAYEAMAEDVTSFLPALDDGYGNVEHTAVVGDISALTFGLRTGATLEVSRTGEGFRKGSIQIRGYLRFGAYLTDPGAICIMRGMTAPAGASCTAQPPAS